LFLAGGSAEGAHAGDHGRAVFDHDGIDGPVRGRHRRDLLDVERHRTAVDYVGNHVGEAHGLAALLEVADHVQHEVGAAHFDHAVERGNHRAEVEAAVVGAQCCQRLRYFSGIVGRFRDFTYAGARAVKAGDVV